MYCFKYLREISLTAKIESKAIRFIVKETKPHHKQIGAQHMIYYIIHMNYHHLPATKCKAKIKKKKLNFIL